MGDIYHQYPATLGYEILKMGRDEPLLRDEIYLQMIKQTTGNPEIPSVVHGLQLMYLCLSTFAPSSDIKMFLFSHLAIFARREYPMVPIGFNTKGDLATNCWVAFQLLTAMVEEGDCADIPEISDIDLLIQGKFAKISLVGVPKDDIPMPPPSSDMFPPSDGPVPPPPDGMMPPPPDEEMPPPPPEDDESLPPPPPPPSDD